MKKFLLLILGIFVANNFVFAKDITKPVNSDKKINQAIEIIKHAPNKKLYEYLTTNNNTNYPTIIQFSDLKKFPSLYHNFDSLCWKVNGKLYIYINSKHKNAPVEAIAAHIAGRVINIDNETSINEELISMTNEGLMWIYLTNNNYPLLDSGGELVQRLNFIIRKISNNDVASGGLRKIIVSHPSYANYPETSAGYSDVECESELKRLYEIYSEYFIINSVPLY